MQKQAVTLLLGCALLGAAAPAKPLTVSSVFTAVPPWGAQPQGIVWSPNSRYFLYAESTQAPFKVHGPLYIYDTATHRSRVFIDPRSFGKKAGTPSETVWSPDSSEVAFTEQGTLYVRGLGAGANRKVAAGASDPQWSPKGGAIAYVHDADLYVASLGGAKVTVRRITTGGKEGEILNGELDWVYPEEMDIQHGYRWSPDGSAIAYLRLDERPVTNFPIVDFLKTDNTVHDQRYPLAGEKNPRASLHLVTLSDGRNRTLYDAGPKDEYVPLFGWKPHSQELLMERLNRAQTDFSVLAWPRIGAAPQTIYAQRDREWVSAVFTNSGVQLPKWLPNGDSLWVLDRDGDGALYLRTAAGALRRLTGAYRVMDLLGVDAKRGIAYVSAGYPSRRYVHLLAVPIRGGAVRDLTPAAGSDEVTMAPNARSYVDAWSSFNDPPRTDLVAVSGGRVTIAPENLTLKSALLPTAMLEVPSKYGPLDAYMIKPPNFDPSKRYPVIQYVYGGPASPTTTDLFGGQMALYSQLLARAGFIVFSVDGPASQVDSDAHVRLLYHNFGPGSLMGQEIGARYLASLPYVDPSKIGIWGWSFGGYETVYALEHSTLWAAGAAVAPVTDWHYYDTIYTERYMGEPQHDGAGYDRSSNLTAAAHLHGDLLISHGTSDDNVHMANTIALLQRYIYAGKTHVDFYVYPRRTHSIAGLPQRTHLFSHMLQWWERHL